MSPAPIAALLRNLASRLERGEAEALDYEYDAEVVETTDEATVNNRTFRLTGLATTTVRYRRVEEKEKTTE